MHEYSYYGRGNTIHSPGQIEWFQNTCDDKSFQCRTGLMYKSLLGQPTDADLNTYPHVLLTGPHDLDPSVLDYTHPTTSGDTTGAPHPSLRGAHDPRIDDFGNYKGRIPSSPTLHSTNMLSPLNPLTLRSSGPILAGSTNTPLRKPSTKPLNGLLLPLGTP